MQGDPEVSVVVCTYNRARFLQDTLRTLRDQTHPPGRYEVIVVDNNSSDSTRDIASTFAETNPDAQIRYVFEAKQGLSHGRNRGIREAQAEVIAFVDDDIFADEDYVRVVAEFFAGYRQAVAAGGRVIMHSETEEPAWLSSYLRPLYGEQDLGAQIRPYPRNQYPVGCNMCFRKEALDRFGWFNPNLGRKARDLLGGEEKDMFERIRAGHGSIYYLPHAVVRHRMEAERFTEEFVRRQAVGIGRSEKRRVAAGGTVPVLQKAGSEMVKAAGSTVLAVIFAARLRFSAAAMLLKFRYWVWQGLLGRREE